jgi:error-prone DNA polymerase
MYTELHAASAFSFLDGASSPEELAQACAHLNMPAMALMDRDNVSGAPRFYMAAKKLGIKAHLGAEITGADGCVYPLLAENRTGYQNLCRLITAMKLRAAKGEGEATIEELARFAEGLICLAGESVLWPCREAGSEKSAEKKSKVSSQDSELKRARRDDTAQRRIEQLKHIYGANNVYVEVQRHMVREQEARNQFLSELAESHQLPVLATNGVRFATPQKRDLYDALSCVRLKTKLETAGRLLARNAERYLKSAEQMARLFAHHPHAIANARELSSRLDFTLADLGYQFPKYPVPFGETMISFLARRTWEGARHRFRPLHERARAQIERELKLIEKLDLSGYFLIVWDLVEFCRREGILVQGRGSAANSAVCYSLGITAVDPIKMELLFERFLSEERGEWPDIDLDLPSGDQRERVIQHVYKRYGERGAAMTANVITYRGRSSAREMGKVLGFAEEDCARLASLVSRWGWQDPEETVERQFREAGFDLADPRIRKFAQLYMQAQDLPRHLGQHSGGMVVCQGALDTVVPLEPASMPNRVIVQWDKEDCADLGIIKIDLLGLGMMAVLEQSIQIIRDNYKEEVDLAHIPQDDPKVYQTLQRADTVGMFQVESRAQMSCLPRLKPKCFYDIVVQVAIIRPGPIVGKMLHPYLRRRQGMEQPVSLHPSLDAVLKRTNGVPLFQEQLLRMAMIVAGFTGGEAEELRRAMGFKRSEKRMLDIEKRLRQGMNERGITGETQDTIVQSITSFALYGFPESHAASFALIAYASAYLKCHYLPAFTAALLNNQPMGFYHPATLVKDAQRHGLRFLPVDVTRSEVECVLEPNRTPGTNEPFFVRLGLNYVKGLRAETAQQIVAARRERAFSSVDDLARRVAAIHKDELRALAKVGAMNNIGKKKTVEEQEELRSLGATPQVNRHRRDALWEAEFAARPRHPLFAGLEPAMEASPLDAMSDLERLNADFQGTSLTIGKHPLSFWREELDRKGVLRASQLNGLPDGKWVKVAGCVICRQRPGTANGFLFLSLEDETGISNGIVIPKLFEENRAMILTNPYLLIEGFLQNQQGALSIKVQRLQPLRLTNTAAQPSHDFR